MNAKLIVGLSVGVALAGACAALAYKVTKFAREYEEEFGDDDYDDLCGHCDNYDCCHSASHARHGVVATACKNAGMYGKGSIFEEEDADGTCDSCKNRSKGSAHHVAGKGIDDERVVFCSDFKHKSDNTSGIDTNIAFKGAEGNVDFFSEKESTKDLEGTLTAIDADALGEITFDGEEEEFDDDLDDVTVHDDAEDVFNLAPDEPLPGEDVPPFVDPEGLPEDVALSQVEDEPWSTEE